MTEPKLCKDCRWAVNTQPDYRPTIPGLAEYAWRCQHPSATRPPRPPSRVTGYVELAEQWSCPEARSDHHEACGPEGRFWEARET
jgi:hypothetical protein